MLALVRSPLTELTSGARSRYSQPVPIGIFKVTLPPEADGKKVTFVTTVDDYGEVWVDGKLPRKVGQVGGSVVAGFNAPNRVELADAKAGKTYQIAVFGINGPISAEPGNYIFLRDTFLEIADKE